MGIYLFIFVFLLRVIIAFWLLYSMEFSVVKSQFFVFSLQCLMRNLILHKLYFLDINNLLVWKAGWKSTSIFFWKFWASLWDCFVQSIIIYGGDWVIQHLLIIDTSCNFFIQSYAGTQGSYIYLWWSRSIDTSK
jgi:hypothetical protein